MSDLGLIVVGSLIGSVIGPILLRHYEEYRNDKAWAQPRKELLKKMLSDPDHRFRSIEKLSLTTGTSVKDCRSLLIDIKARGGKMKSGREAWALISRAPLKEDLKQIAQEKEEDT